MVDNLPGVVEDYFHIEGHLISTRSADAYKAIDKSRQAPITLWLLRHPLALNSGAVQRFLARMHLLSGIPNLVAPVGGFGVDAAGMAFAVLPAMDGTPVGEGVTDIGEAERRFVMCVRTVEALHNVDVVCGDLCGSSFIAGRGGEVSLVGIMGSFDTEAAQTAMLPPAETLHYMAPEQRTGGGVEKASDVYSLGVLGYYMFTGAYPFGPNPPMFTGASDIKLVRCPSEVKQGCPEWADVLLLRCLEASPSARFAHAGALREELDRTRQRKLDRASAPIIRIPRTVSGVEAKPHLEDNAPPIGEEVEAEGEQSENPPRKGARRALILAAMSVGVAAGVIVLSARQSPSPQPASPLTLHESVASSDGLRKAISILSRDNIPVAEREEYLRTIVNSDDPVAHEVLVRTAVDSASPEVRQLSERAVIERARRLGLMRSAEEIRQWLPTVASPSQAPAYEPLLKTLNTSIPLDARGTLLRQAYAAAPKVALRVAGALALDTEDLEGFHPILAPLVGDDLHIDDADEHSSAALILASPDLAGRYGADIIRKSETLRDGDILWVLQMLAGRSDINVRAVASLALERNIVAGIRQSYLTIVRDRGDLSPDVLGALVRASTGRVTADDVSAFGRWYDLVSEKVLLSLCADLEDKELAIAAFDMLAGRSLTVRPVGDIIEWIRGEAWEKRSDFVRVVGILGNLDFANADTVTEALAAFDPHVKDSQIMATLLASENPIVIRSALKRYVKMLSLGRLLMLLDNPDAEVRTLAIRGMGAVNDAGVLKLIIDHYEKEKDPGVRTVYKDTFWVIRQREEGRS